MRRCCRAMRGDCITASLPVVPANAGTHTSRILILRSDVDALLYNECQRLWVPAFAGTTARRFSFSRHGLSEVCHFVRSPIKSEGAGKTGCALHPRSRVHLML